MSKKCNSNQIVVSSTNDNAAVSHVPPIPASAGPQVDHALDMPDLGQKFWDSASKNYLAKLKIDDVQNKCSELKSFMTQQKQHTGFIPLSPLQFSHIRNCSRCQVDKHWLEKPIQLYHYVKSFKRPNFLGARVQINFDMNLDLVDRLAESYWDWQLPLFLRYGFPMDFRGSHLDLRDGGSCHPSARQYPEHVEAYINDELEHGAICGPFTDKPFGDETHVSPFITRHKPDSDKRRVIIDLSWPQSASVNYFTKSNEYLGTAFKLNYPSVDNYVDRLTSLGKGCHMLKVDLSRAFRQLKVDPADYPLLWQDAYYLDRAYAFGHRTGSMGCSRLSDFIRYLHSNKGFYLLSYIDDLLGAETPSNAQASYDTLVNLLQELRIPVSKSKLCPPSTKIICLGIHIDSVEATLSIPDEKLQEILKNCVDFLKLKKFTKRQLQSMIGSLMYVHKVVKPARYFVNRLLENLRNMNEVQFMNEDVVRDVTWFLKFVKRFNGKCKYIYPPLQCSDRIELDACLTGVGGRYNNQVYQYQFRNNEVPCTFSIVHLEMWNVLIGIRIWAKQWANRAIVIKCDNEAVVGVVNKGVTRDSALAAMACNIWFVTASHNIRFQVVHIPGVNNMCADLLSRWGSTVNRCQKLQAQIPEPVWLKVTSEHMYIDTNI